MLNLLAEKTIHQHLSSECLLAYCPTMDLLAVATKEEQVFVYRLNGQRVFGAAQKGTQSRVEHLRWKPNGQLLAITWSDRVTRLVGADNSKIIHQIQVLPQINQRARVTCIGWGLNFTDPKAVRVQLGSTLGSVLDEFLSQSSQANLQGHVRDLPADLALSDVDLSLPRLSTLPSGGKDEDVFSSRNSIDSMFFPLNKKENDAVDVLLIALDDGTLHLSIYDCFEIGTFTLEGWGPLPAGSRALVHASHPFSSTHSLLVGTKDNDTYFVPLDLRFISCSGGYLSLLASKSTQLQNLLRYITQVQQHMETEWRSSQDLPAKFIKNINESLKEKLQSNLVESAHSLVTSGDCPDIMKEWLIDELTERGHKRWDKAVTTGYENIRRLAHEHMLPALERCDVLVSRLRGLSRYEDSNATLGVAAQDLSNVLDTVKCLRALTHTILNYIDVELSQFLAFSTWLRHEIDTQAAENSGSTPEDPPDKDTAIEHTKVISYIQGAMTKSRLAEVFALTTNNKRSQWNLQDEGASVYDLFSKELKKYRSNAHMDKMLPGLGPLSEHLTRQCGVVFKRVAEAEKRDVLLGRPLFLMKERKSSITDVRMSFENDQCLTYVVLHSTEPQGDHVNIFRIFLTIINGVSSTETAEVASIVFDNAVIRDIKFVDDECIMFIHESASGSDLLSVCYSPESGSPLQYLVRYEKASSASPANPTVSQAPHESPLHISAADLQDFSRHHFPATETGFMPAKLEVNGRKGRRVVCVLGRDRLHYRVFDVDGEAEDGASEAGTASRQDRDDHERMSF